MSSCLIVSCCRSAMHGQDLARERDTAGGQACRAGSRHGREDVSASATPTQRSAGQPFRPRSDLDHATTHPSLSSMTREP